VLQCLRGGCSPDKGTLTVIVFKDPGEAVAGEETETKAESAEKTLAEKAVTRM